MQIIICHGEECKKVNDLFFDRNVLFSLQDSFLVKGAGVTNEYFSVCFTDIKVEAERLILKGIVLDHKTPVECMIYFMDSTQFTQESHEKLKINHKIGKVGNDGVFELSFAINEVSEYLCFYFTGFFPKVYSIDDLIETGTGN